MTGKGGKMKIRLGATGLRGLVGAGLITAFALAGATGCSDAETVSMPASPADIGLVELQVRAPDFTLPTLGGGTFTLSDLQGKPVVLTFWNFECVRCQEEMPFMMAASTDFLDSIQFVGVHLLGTEAEVQQFFGDADLDMLVPLDLDGQIAAGYNISYTPTTFFIDSEGIVRFTKMSQFTNYGDVAAAVNFTLAADA
jgi:cytochrome c biogenesis protein CcmG/thiol:disulfide interchange protein DsbE